MQRLSQSDSHSPTPIMIKRLSRFTSHQRCLRNSTNIPENSREFYTDHATTLYNEVWAKLSTSDQAKLSGTFNYGFGARKLTGIVAKGDGPTLIFALICLFRNCVGLESEIKTLFLLADRGFAKHSNPMITVDNLRASLNKATILKTSMEWSETGAKMVEQLSYADHNTAKALEDYTDIQPADNQTVVLIARTFAIIERTSKGKVLRDSKDGNKRACVANALNTRGINNAQHVPSVTTNVKTLGASVAIDPTAPYRLQKHQ